MRRRFLWEGQFGPLSLRTGALESPIFYMWAEERRNCQLQVTVIYVWLPVQPASLFSTQQERFQAPVILLNLLSNTSSVQILNELRRQVGNFIFRSVYIESLAMSFVKITIIICNFSLCLANQVFSHEKKLFHGEKVFLEWEFVNWPTFMCWR